MWWFGLSCIFFSLVEGSFLSRSVRRRFVIPEIRRNYVTHEWIMIKTLSGQSRRFVLESPEITIDEVRKFAIDRFNYNRIFRENDYSFQISFRGNLDRFTIYPVPSYGEIKNKPISMVNKLFPDLEIVGSFKLNVFMIPDDIAQLAVWENAPPSSFLRPKPTKPKKK